MVKYYLNPDGKNVVLETSEDKKAGRKGISFPVAKINAALKENGLQDQIGKITNQLYDISWEGEPGKVIKSIKR